MSKRTFYAFASPGRAQVDAGALLDAQAYLRCADSLLASASNALDSPDARSRRGQAVWHISQAFRHLDAAGLYLDAAARGY